MKIINQNLIQKNKIIKIIYILIKIIENNIKRKYKIEMNNKN